MKTKLMTVMMMGLALFGATTGITFAGGNAGNATTDYATVGGFGSTVGVQGIVGVVGTQNAGNNAANDGLLKTVNKTINWILGMLAMIALAVCLWGGFQMVTAAGESGRYDKGFTILKQAAVGLIVVGVSWIVVSFVFWVIGALATPGTAPTISSIGS